ncbi:MAG: hypothetical protein HQ581_03590 [Planctomycetes bacterium]|nr:hypothetical protein [Planctomycetota bacterium]
MNTSTPEFDAHETTLDDHRALQWILEAIDRALLERTASTAEIGTLLTQLGGVLIQLFEQEEEGGYFADAISHAPRMVARANALMAQHPAMAATAKAIAQNAHHGDGSDDWWDRTQELFRAFVDELGEHELHENRLLQEVYAQDIGSHG